VGGGRILRFGGSPLLARSPSQLESPGCMAQRVAAVIARSLLQLLSLVQPYEGGTCCAAPPFTPRDRNSECLPHVGTAPFQQIEPVRVARNGQLECVVGVIAPTVAINQPLKRPLDLKPRPAAQEGVREVKEHVAMDDLR
jgi:hypothetical protein